MEATNQRHTAPSRSSDQFVIRMPDGMRDRIKTRSEANRRSMNAEVIVLLEAAMGESEKTQGVPA
jgi:plasmid stability protein